MSLPDAVVWLGQDALYRVIAESPARAANALREHLISRQEIGKWSTVSVELEAVTRTPGVSLYREVD